MNHRHRIALKIDHRRGLVRVERTGSRPPSALSLSGHMCTTPAPPPMPPGLASCMQLHYTAHTHCPDIRYDLPCSTFAHQMPYQEGRGEKGVGGAALCGRRTFRSGPNLQIHQLSAGAARVPSETFWRTPNSQSWWVLSSMI